MKRNIIIHILKRWILFLCFHVVRTDIVGRLKISDVANVKSSMVDKNLVVCVGVIEDIPNSVTVYTCTAALFSNKADENPTVGLSFNAEQIFSHIIIFDGESWEKVNAIGGATDIAPKLFVEDVLDYVMMPFLFPDEEVHPVHTIGGIKFNVALSCMKNRFGQRCLQYCNVEESGEKYFCHPITGEMICRSGWVGKDCSEKVQDVDSQFFKTRPKRSEGERIDCSRRRCSPREMLRQFLTAPVFNRGVEMDFREPENITICSEEACDPVGMQMCLIDEGRPVCRCKPGYFGDRCSETDKCYLELCKNGAVCEKLEEGGSICNCPDGFEGEYCEEQTDLCLLEPCGPLGECVSDVRGFLCHCAVGLTGERCEIDINDCLNDSCSGRGKCHDGINSYDCVCDEGYGGKSCEIELNGCTGDPCQNGGRCASYGDGYYECDCLEGYEGTTCSEKIEDPCSTNPCNGNGNCYAKIVEEGEELDHLYKRVAHCSCDEGYSGEYCETVVSFCDEEDAYCPSNATCVNLKEEYTCVCPPGYEGEFCEKECDECQEQSELRCEENPCKNGARCVAIGEHVQCICGKGYYGSKCEKYVDYCIESPCESGICQSTRDGFECLCDEGFTGDLCGEDVNECEIQTNLCKHGGECVNFYGGYECNCLKGYVGEHCDHELDACSSNPCLHGGSCLPQGEYSFICQCKLGYTGWTCEEKVECEINPCHNGGKCELTPLQEHEYRCHCGERYFGAHCEDEITACEVKKEKPDGSYEIAKRTDCAHGMCRPDGDRDFKCECYEGYEGKFCDQRIKTTECKEAYCVCESGIPNHKYLNMKSKTEPKCSHQIYGSGNCKLDDCLETMCNNPPQFVCQYESECPEQEVSPRLPLGRHEICAKLIISFNRKELPEGSTLQGVCENFRRTEVIKEFDNLAVKCFLQARTNDSVKISVSFETQSKPNALIIREKFLTYLTRAITSRNVSGIQDLFKATLFGAIENISDGRKIVSASNIRDSTLTPGTTTTTRTYESNSNLIIAIVCVSVFVLVLLAIGVFIWLRKRKSERTPTPVQHHLENNNVPISSVKFSKNMNEKANPLFLGRDNEAFSCESSSEERISTIQLRNNSNTTETSCANPVRSTSYIPS